MHKPISGFGAHAAVVLAPFAIPFVGFEFLNNYSRLFQRRENVERLLRRIEELNRAPAAKDD